MATSTSDTAKVAATEAAVQGDVHDLVRPATSTNGTSVDTAGAVRGVASDKSEETSSASKGNVSIEGITDTDTRNGAYHSV